MKIAYRIILFFLFCGILAGLIAFARGYRIDLNKKSFTSTGILAVSSSPKAAKIFINDELKGVTDTSLTLSPGTYRIHIKKEGYTSWNKTITIKGELVFSVDALLFPLNPSLSPLTNLGIIKAFPLDQTEQILLASENNDIEKDGIYLFEAGKKTLSLLPPLTLIILKKDIPGYANLQFSNMEVVFSPDYSQAIIEFPPSTENEVSSAYLISMSEKNTIPIDATNSKETLIEAWDLERNKDHSKILETFPISVEKIATDSFKIISFSPDETKLLYRAKNDITIPPGITPPLIATNQTQEERTIKAEGLYIYDKKEDKNYRINIDENTSEIKTTSILWFPDSKHVVFNEDNKISIIDYDDTNKQVIYSGPFNKSFFTITSDGKLIVLTNLNPENNKFPDLYLAGIR